MGSHQILGLLCFLFFLYSSLPFASLLCPPDQCNALLNLKNSFALDSESSRTCEEDYHVTSYPKTNSWNKGVDCCLWDGVTCNEVTGNIIGLDLTCSWLYGTLHSNSSLFLLRHLRSLNLFGNNFDDSPILPNLTTFVKMTHLNLSRSQFRGTIPSEISHLSKLVSLDLSFCPLQLENSIFTMLVWNLTSLRKLALHSVSMSTVSPKGIVPDTFFQLPSLTYLDMSYNFYLFGILPKSNWTSPLEFLSLSSTSFSGEIPKSIGNVKNLTILDLTNSNFTGLIPSSLGNLKQLQFLDLSFNNFSGVVEFDISANTKLEHAFPMLEVLVLSSCNLTRFPYFLKSLKRLTYLDLSFNNISGEIPKWFWEISHDTLEHLDLSQNLLGGGIPQLHWKRLSYINLQNNSFQGPLPIPSPFASYFHAADNGFTGEIDSSICQLNSLLELDLSNNYLFGNIPPCFGNTTNLMHLDLSSNNLRGPLPRSLVKSTNLSWLYLNHNEFSDIFPQWLEAPNLQFFDLQFNKFYGRINITAFALSFPTLNYLSISNNHFTSLWPSEGFSNTSLLTIDLSNNNFGGPIPLPSPFTFYYSIASNSITGKIPSWFCNATHLEVIILSNNDLMGSLPRCFTNLSTSLSVLNLRKNHLEGTIPPLFLSRSMLTTLDLSQNLFEGTLPRSLVNCEHLQVLDLSNNRIEDTFPTWLGALQELKVLVLKSNNFKDLLNIPKGAHLFPKLHILDLSNNNFGGPLPANLIMNLKAMLNSEDGQEKSLYMTSLYETSITVTMKGREIELVKILTVFTTIDLSCNSFQGDIPGVIGHLHSLIGLNLSHNHLTGPIPLTLGNLTDLEWLDLSSNKLSGRIPRKLGDLAFLGYLNLSKNQLTGQIPQDKQLSTFSSNSFGGNPGLCGTPLPKACPSDAQHPQPSPSSTFNHEGHGSWFKHKVVWIGYASGIIIGISIEYIAFETGRPKWLLRVVRMLERRAAKWMEKPKQKAIKFHGK
ncbi:hypothetical protein BT93_B1439 [Corymbia citriodora subsp. variegata]|nr:hypothetical protein BT93_B1439 [Corymbia citriodora subsp. variegata]